MTKDAGRRNSFRVRFLTRGRTGGKICFNLFCPSWGGAFPQGMVSLLFSFMVIWDLPNLRRGMRDLKTSRLGFAYNTISPQVRRLVACVRNHAGFTYTYKRGDKIKLSRHQGLPRKVPGRLCVRACVRVCMMTVRHNGPRLSFSWKDLLLRRLGHVRIGVVAKKDLSCLSSLSGENGAWTRDNPQRVRHGSVFCGQEARRHPFVLVAALHRHASFVHSSSLWWCIASTYSIYFL